MFLLPSDLWSCGNIPCSSLVWHPSLVLISFSQLLMLENLEKCRSPSPEFFIHTLNILSLPLVHLPRAPLVLWLSASYLSLPIKRSHPWLCAFPLLRSCLPPLLLAPALLSPGNKRLPPPRLVFAFTSLGRVTIWGDIGLSFFSPPLFFPWLLKYVSKSVM